MFSIRHSVTFIGRSLPFSDDRHYKLCSANFEQNVIISRRHARIVRCEESNVHSIYDDSMNGVFVNDTKIDGKILSLIIWSTLTQIRLSVLFHLQSVMNFIHMNVVNITSRYQRIK